MCFLGCCVWCKLIRNNGQIVKTINFISDAIYVDSTAHAGRGVFASRALRSKEVVETAPVIVMSKGDRLHLDQTVLHDYIFEWGSDSEQCCMALGYVPLYNHSYRSNCEYEMNFRRKTITVRTVRKVEAGEELTINYNGDWNNEKRVWFDVT